MPCVYVLCFSPAFKQAKHYIGFTTSKFPKRRVNKHLRGEGSPLVKAALAAGSTVTVAHVFKGADRTFERQIKNRKDTPKWCPCCQQHKRPIPKIRCKPVQLSLPFSDDDGDIPF